MIQLTDKAFAITMPEGAENCEIRGAHPGRPYLLLSFFGEGEAVELPAGEYKIVVFNTKTATEEDARKVVAWIEIVGKVGYYDYMNPEPYRYLESWEDSLNALLRSENLDTDKNYALIEKL